VPFPVTLDNTVMKTPQARAGDIRRARHIGDFRQWKEHNAYRRALDRLLRDLQAEARGKLPPKPSPCPASVRRRGHASPTYHDQ
jgi:hypothetical protein